MATGAAIWILADWATRRLNPQIASATDLQLVDLHMRAELTAYDAEGFSDRSQAAEIGALRAVDLADDAKTLTRAKREVLRAPSGSSPGLSSTGMMTEAVLGALLASPPQGPADGLDAVGGGLAAVDEGDGSTTGTSIPLTEETRVAEHGERVVLGAEPGKDVLAVGEGLGAVHVPNRGLARSSEGAKCATACGSVCVSEDPVVKRDHPAQAVLVRGAPDGYLGGEYRGESAECPLW